MDFQEIRRKAKERAARAAAGLPAAVPAGPVSPAPSVTAAVEPKVPGRLIEGDDARSHGDDHPDPGAPVEASGPGGPFHTTPRRPAPGSPEALRLEVELASRLAALAPAADARFVTWRPDGGPLLDVEAVAPPAMAPTDPPRAAFWPTLALDPLDDFLYREDEAVLLPGLVPAASSGLLVKKPVALDEFLIVRLAEEEFGVEIGRVLEVLRTPPVTEVPRAPPDILGVISVRGDVITVVDPRSRLGLARGGAGPARRVVVVDDGDGACGLLVDGVAGVVRLPRGALEPCPQAIGAGGGDAFIGIGREQQRLFTVLDVRALLRPLRRTAEIRPT